MLICGRNWPFKTLHCGTRSQTSKSQGLIRANYFFAYIKCQTTEFTMRRYQSSASVSAKSASPIVPKLHYILQYFMLFPMMYSKLGHKLTNVKTARINMVIIALICLKIYTAQTSIFSKRLRKICLFNWSRTRLYCAVFHALSSEI
jgi:hypothetical protein